MTEPRCPCHGEPMHRNGVVGGRQRWRCSVRNYARYLERIDEDARYRVSHSIARARGKRRRITELARERAYRVVLPDDANV